jgi:hypothetical protein
VKSCKQNKIQHYNFQLKKDGAIAKIYETQKDHGNHNIQKPWQR